MILRLRDLQLKPAADRPAALRKAAAQRLNLSPTEIEALQIVRRSIDARKKADVRLLYTVDVKLPHGFSSPVGEVVKHTESYSLPIPKKQPELRPVIVGFGPAGMFAALALAEAGLRPLVLERGRDVDTRTAQVQRFQKTGILDPESNVQFGEGGAGAFSDGKLHTGVSGSRVSWILRRFAEFGAGESVVWEAAPHVGTDVLRNVVKAIRIRILSLGGEIRFGTRMTGLLCGNGSLQGIQVETASGIDALLCKALFLAVGHSARDTLTTLFQQGVPMEAKPFAMGVRIEQCQREIDIAQYGRFAGEKALGAAPYKLAVHLPDGTGVYTFCMCPGGYVMAAASELDGVVTNGMSYSGRAGTNANAALLASLTPAQFPYPGALGGMHWQRELEQAAFRYGGGSYLAPAQQVGDFLSGQSSTGPGRILPSYQPGVRWGSLDAMLPSVITRPLRQALPLLERKLRGFADPQAVLTGPETRSSSPVRLLRDSRLQSPGFSGLYPCGEGAGWAGGIVSAAADALRCCEAYLSSL